MIKDLQHKIDELEEEIEELKNRNEFLRDLRDRLIATIKDDYILKQIIEDKMNYLDNQQKQWLEDRELKEDDGKIIFARDTLKELLN